MKELDDLLKLTNEIKKENEAERKTRKPLAIFCLILMAAGIYMLWYHTSWQITLAIFFLFWANNISVKLGQR